MKPLLLLLSLSILSSCATLSPGAARVREFAGNIPTSCLLLKPVVGSSSSSVGLDHYAIATMDIKNETAKAGGNYYYVNQDNSAALFGKIYGDAYLCDSNVQWTVQQPSAESQIVNQMKRQNDLMENQQKANAIQSFINSLPQNRKPTDESPKKFNCNSTYNSHFNSFDTQCNEH